MAKKKKKKSNKNKKGYLKYLIITVILVLFIALVYVFLNAKDDNTSLTVVEKKWISDNSGTLMDINVPNNLNILGDNGKGVLFDYIKKVENDTDLSFNKKSYNYEESSNNLTGLSILVLKNGEKIKNNDNLITEDNYVLVSSKNEKVDSLKTISKNKIGITSNDSKFIKNVVGENYTYKEYKSINSLLDSFTKKEVDYAIVPRYYSLNEIVANKLFINYTFDDIANKIVLRAEGNKNLNSIMDKYLVNFKNNDYFSSYEKSFMRFYEEKSGASDLNITSLSNEVYNYGYVKDSNYNIKQGRPLGGYAGEYINMIRDMAHMDIEYKSYSDKEALTKAIESGDIDIAFIDFDYDNTNGLYTTNGFNTALVALSKTNYQMFSKDGLNNRKVYALKNTPITSYLKENISAKVNEISSINKTPDDGVLVLDEIDYYYYTSKNKLDGYYTVAKDYYNSNYRFFVQTDEKVLYDYINFCLNYSDSNSIKQNSVNNLVSSGINRSNFLSSYFIIVLAIVVPIILLFIIIVMAKNKTHTKLLRKESVLKYTDMLTSLKNRNYLRANIDEWDEAKIAHRAVIVIDLNNLSYVNDNYGQDEGNELIKKAAAILINTQLEKSEIMRTDGNEFLLYLIGYTETQVNTYIGKLSREFEKLPYNFGAAIGYSMIEDEIKTIGDAINEANIAMRKDKEQNYK